MAEKQQIRARRVTQYPPPKYKTMLENYVVINKNRSESEVATVALKQFFDRMPATEQEKYKSSNHY